AGGAAGRLGRQHRLSNPGLGFPVGINAFTAAVLGGIGSSPGAMLGGLLLGVAEAFGADAFGDQFQDVVAFGLLLLVLLFILGLKLRNVGMKLEVLGAETKTIWTIATAVLTMFVWQLFRDSIPLKLGRDVGYKVNGSGLKNFLSLPSSQRCAVHALVM
ncbi:DUF3382 domain-containing protein, partial [Pseudomonas aeruginosa]